MNKMNRKSHRQIPIITILFHFSLTIIICICLLTSGCDIARPGTSWDSGYHAPGSIIEIAVPPVPELHPRFDKIELLEEDIYGRRLYCYTVYGWCSNINIYLICQREADGYAFYYENVCYNACESKGEFSLEQLSNLKQKNDWGMPLQQGKMLARKIGRKPKEDIFYAEDITKIAKRVLNIQSGDSVMANSLEKDIHGRQLYFIYVFKSGNMPHEAYIGIWEKSTQQPIVLEPIAYSLNLQDEIVDFKAKNQFVSAKEQ